MTASTEEYLAYLRHSAALNELEIEEFALPSDHDVVLNGHRFHYLDWERGSEQTNAPTVVLLHGRGLNAHTWDLTCLALRPRYRCIALDLRGHGDSEWSPTVDYRPRTFVDDLRRLVEHLQIERLILVGMSLGGMTSLGYAVAPVYPLSDLIIVDIAPRPPVPSELRPSTQNRSRVRDFMSLPVPLDTVEEFVSRSLTFNPRRDPDMLRISLMNNLRQLPNGQWTWKYDRRFLEGGIPGEPPVPAISWSDAPSISCETLLVRGAESDVLSRTTAELFVAALPRGNLVEIPNAGHTVQGDNPPAFISAVRSFLDRV